MNEARRLYFSTYFHIDVVDHLLKKAAIFYRIWKDRHAPKNHGIAIAIVLAYDVCLECVEGNIRIEWFIPEKKGSLSSILGIHLANRHLPTPQRCSDAQVTRR